MVENKPPTRRMHKKAKELLKQWEELLYEDSVLKVDCEWRYPYLLSFKETRGLTAVDRIKTLRLLSDIYNIGATPCRESKTSANETEAKLIKPRLADSYKTKPRREATKGTTFDVIKSLMEDAEKPQQPKEKVELFFTPLNYKTVPCRLYHSATGCVRGEFCHFIHAEKYAGKEVPTKVWKNGRWKHNKSHSKIPSLAASLIPQLSQINAIMKKIGYTVPSDNLMEQIESLRSSRSNKKEPNNP